VQFEISMMACAMIKNLRIIRKSVIVITYVFGLRIADLPESFKVMI